MASISFEMWWLQWILACLLVGSGKISTMAIVCLQLTWRQPPPPHRSILAANRDNLTASPASELSSRPSHRSPVTRAPGLPLSGMPTWRAHTRRPPIPCHTRSPPIPPFHTRSPPIPKILTRARPSFHTIRIRLPRQPHSRKVRGPASQSPGSRRHISTIRVHKVQDPASQSPGGRRLISTIRIRVARRKRPRTIRRLASRAYIRRPPSPTPH